MLKKRKGLLAKFLVIYTLTMQIFSAGKVTALAQPKEVKELKQNKTKKLTKKDIMALLKHKLHAYNKKAAAHEAAKAFAIKRAKIYSKKISKAPFALRQALAVAKIKAVEAAMIHSRKQQLYVKKVNALSARLSTYAVAKKVLAGKASWYNWVGRRTASGEIFKAGALTAAMRGFRGHKVKVVNLANNKSVIVKINDYGPARWTGRVIDLSATSFSKIASTRQGVIPKVKIYVY